MWFILICCPLVMLLVWYRSVPFNPNNQGKLLERILLISDPHRSENSLLEEERWYPNLCERLIQCFGAIGRRLALAWLNWWDNLTQKSLDQILARAQILGPFDRIIMLGDATAGSNEQGMLTLKAQDDYRAFRRVTQSFFPNVPEDDLWGNHDVGYRYATNTVLRAAVRSPRGRISIESIEIAEKLIGKPFQIITVGSWKLLLSNSEIFHCNDYYDDVKLRSRLADRCVEQRMAILEQLDLTSQALLFAHDPFVTIGELLHSIDEKNRKKIKGIFCGHVHARIVGWWLRLRNALAREFDLQIIPGTWGVFGFRRGFAILELYEHNYTLRVHYL